MFVSPKVRAWIVCLFAGLLFFYEFIQMNFLDTLGSNLMQELSLNAEQLGTLSAFYFYSNLLFLLPAGWLLDKYSTKKLILTALGICVTGTFIFSQAHAYNGIAFARFLTGIGSAFCFLSCMRLAQRWFPSQSLGSIIGAIVTLAMLGGTLAHTPLTLLKEAYGWRHAVIADACLGVIFWLLILLVVRDAPANYKVEQPVEFKSANTYTFWQGSKLAYINKQNWFCGLYTMLMNSPIAILGALWGTLYIERVHNLGEASASTISGSLFLGTVLGCLFFGWLSDKLKRRQLLMWVGALVALINVLLICYWPTQNFMYLMGLFIALGFITSTQIMSYPIVTESNSPLLTARAGSVISFCVISGYAIFQPLFGYFMDLRWHGEMLNGERFYSADTFTWAIALLPILIIISFFISLGVRETYAKQSFVEKFSPSLKD